MGKKCKVVFILVFILMINMVCGRISESSAAAGYSQWVNPAYKNLFKEKPLSFFAQTQRSGAAECRSFDEIVSALREKLENRVADFSIRMIYNFRLDEVEGILDQAYDRVISEDDYLHWNMVGWQYSYEGMNGDVIVYYSASYLTAYEQEQQVSQRVSEILYEIISEGMNDEQKEKAIHDWIVLHVEFDQQEENPEHSAYAALFLGHAVCQGYSLLTFKMLKEVDITGRIVYSNDMGHCWNMIYLCGSWYHLDVTWDDPVPDVAGRVLYTFYNRSDAEIQSGDNPHSGWDISKFPQAPVSYEEGVCAIGNIDHKNGVDVKDVILALQICSGIPLSTAVYTDADVNSDGRLGMPEAIYGLRVTAETGK